MSIKVLKKQRFPEKINYHKANCQVIVGEKDTGKSALNENFATRYAEKTKGAKILDLWGSRDNEGLAWCRSPYKDSVLLIVGDSTDLACSWDYKHVSEVKLSDIAKYKVVVSVAAFYSSLKEEHYAIKTIMDSLWRRTHWSDVWYLLIRETANLIYSRLTVGEDQTRAKAYVIYVLREARHMGYAVGADAIRYMSVDIDLRYLADYTCIKQMGQHGLPRSLKWLYAYTNPYYIMRMPTPEFLLLSRKGSIQKCWFEYPQWHKEEKEDLLKIFDIQREHGEEIDYGDKGYKKVSDFEHEKIITLRLDQSEGKRMSYQAIADKLNRSARTPFSQIHSHNEDIKSLGFCQRCRRVKSHFESVTA